MHWTANVNLGTRGVMPCKYQRQLQACSLKRILIKKCVAVIVRALQEAIPLALSNVLRCARGGAAGRKSPLVPQQTATQQT